MTQCPKVYLDCSKIIINQWRKSKNHPSYWPNVVATSNRNRSLESENGVRLFCCSVPTLQLMVIQHFGIKTGSSCQGMRRNFARCNQRSECLSSRCILSHLWENFQSPNKRWEAGKKREEETFMKNTQANQKNKDVSQCTSWYIRDWFFNFPYLHLELHSGMDH